MNTVKKSHLLPAFLYFEYRLSTKYYIPLRTLFHFTSPHRPIATSPITWTGSRAGSLVSVSLVLTFQKATYVPKAADDPKTFPERRFGMNPI
jgi:hypothetical protein